MILAAPTSNPAIDTAVWQAALNTAWVSGEIIGPSPGTYVVNTLIYAGQTICGPGSAHCKIKGMPGQDVFLAPDPTTIPPTIGSHAVLTTFFQVNGITVQVDDTIAGAFSRPIYPVQGAWAANTSYARNAYVSTASGIYACQNNLGGISGQGQPTHTVGEVSDGGCTWLFIDTAQLNVGACGFAFPSSDASQPGFKNLFSEWEDVVFTGITKTNNACGLYSQRPMYATRMQNCRFILNFGLVNAPPTVNWTAAVWDNDTSGYTNLDFFCTNPLILFNTRRSAFTNLTFYSEGLGQRGPYILSFNDKQGILSGTLSWNMLYGEFNEATAGQIVLFMGLGYNFQSSDYSAIGAAAFITFAINASVSTLGIYMLGGTRVVQLWGDYNTFTMQGFHNATIAPSVNGLGNTFTVMPEYSL